MRRRTLIAAIGAAFLARQGPARGDALITEVLPVGFRDAEVLLPVLRPLVPPPGSVNAFRNQLVVRGTPAVIEEVRALLARLDTPPVNLLVSVRRNVDETVRRDLAEAFGRARVGGVQIEAGEIEAGRAGNGPYTGRDRGRGVVIGGRDGDTRGGVRVLRSRNEQRDRSVQRVRVLEGSEAFIEAGESVPVTSRDVLIDHRGARISTETRYEAFTEGFYVRPRIVGDEVLLEVRPRRRARDEGSRRAVVSEAATTIRAPLGRWVDIGSSITGSHVERGRIAAGSAVDRSSDLSLYVKVERLP